MSSSRRMPAVDPLPGTRQEARVLAGGCAFAGVVSLLATLMPFSKEASRGLTAALAVVGLVLGALLWSLQDRVPRLALHLGLAIATVAMGIAIARSNTPAGLAVTAFGYVWIALYSSFFHSRREAAAHVAGIGASFAAGLALAEPMSPEQTWVFVMLSVVAVSVVVNAQVAQLRALAARDPLTGLLTRSAFETAAHRAMAMARRQRQPLAVALIDLDDFKVINDRDGHAAGDRLLAELAEAWSGVLRGSDILGRHGGDEFVLLMPATTVESAEDALQRLAEVSGRARWTAGVVAWGAGDSLPELFERADGALYANKRARTALPEATDRAS